MSRARSSSTQAIAATTPSGPSKAPASRTVSRCEPSRSVPASGSGPDSRPTRFPAASVRVLIPACSIHSATSAFARAIAGVANGRVSAPASSLTAASSRQRPIRSIAAD